MKDPKIAYKTINARVETVDTAPSYRQAFKKLRCLIPVDTFHEWKKVVGGKIPYAIGMKDDSPFVFAGLWEEWKDPATEEWLRTCTIITGEPNELVAQIHTRMRPALGSVIGIQGEDCSLNKTHIRLSLARFNLFKIVVPLCRNQH